MSETSWASQIKAEKLFATPESVIAENNAKTDAVFLQVLKALTALYSRSCETGPCGEHAKVLFNAAGLELGDTCILDKLNTAAAFGVHQRKYGYLKTSAQKRKDDLFAKSAQELLRLFPSD